jgi:hypothetical protein
MGARCPNCRDPLYEPPTRLSRPARPGESVCAVHPGREAVGSCGRCGNYACEVCRTPWRDASLCAACVDRILEKREALPAQVRAHKRQAILAVWLGAGAWLLSVLAFVLFGLTASSGNIGAAMAMFLVFLVALPVSSCAGVIAVGQAVAALRTRGPHMILSTIGLVLGALYVGALMGFLSLSIMMNDR